MLTACSAEIEEIRNELRGCIAARERDFLTLGTELGDISSGAMQLATESQNLITATADNLLDTAAEKLGEHLATMQSVCASTDNSDIELLHSIQTSLRSLLELIANYARITKTLQMLGVSTRIESARLGSDGKGFSTLADDVEKLALKIVEYSTSIRGYVESLHVSSAEAQEQLHQMHDMQMLCEKTLFVSVNSNLEELRTYAEFSRAVSEQITGMTTELNTRVGGVVAGMQVHDIVRQQVEHVEEHLGEVLDYSSLHANSVDEDILLYSIGEVGSLQAAQLTAARKSFYSAVETLKSDLRATGGIVLNIAEAASSSQSQQQRNDAGAMHTSDGVSKDIIATISQGITEISQHIAMLAEQGEGIGDVIGKVVSTVMELSAFLEDIEEVGAEIGLIAMNASIRAAHTGEKGRALGVLASAIQHLSRDAGEQTEAISKALSDVGEMAEKLKNMATGYFNAERAESMTQDLSEQLAHLEEAAGDSANLVEQIHNSAASLADTIECEANSITVHEDISTTLQQAEQTLLKAVEKARSHVENADGIRLPDELQALLSRYTMERERLVHRSILGGETEDSGDIDLFAVEDDSLEAITDAFEDEFGDNIELF